MDSIVAIKIPPTYVAFAKEVAALAEKNGISTCQIKLTPSWRDGEEAARLHGDVTINYSSKDGRGRPCVNLDVFVNATTHLQVVANPESSS